MEFIFSMFISNNSIPEFIRLYTSNHLIHVDFQESHDYFVFPIPCNLQNQVSDTAPVIIRSTFRNRHNKLAPILLYPPYNSALPYSIKINDYALPKKAPEIAIVPLYLHLLGQFRGLLHLTVVKQGAREPIKRPQTISIRVIQSSVRINLYNYRS